jgi:uncharacterized protein YjiS (DUF1127 family)
MRDYALNRALSVGEAPGGSFISRLFRNWLARRAVARLADYDDHMLSDIGLSREDIYCAIRQPLSVNAALILEDRQRQRRRFFVI